MNGKEAKENKCPNCNRYDILDYNYCPNCGYKLYPPTKLTQIEQWKDNFDGEYTLDELLEELEKLDKIINGDSNA